MAAALSIPPLATLWRACVLDFPTIGHHPSTRTEFNPQKAAVRLEIERFRFLWWGYEIGLLEDAGAQQPNPQLEHASLRTAATGLMMGLRHPREKGIDDVALKRRYGLSMDPEAQRAELVLGKVFEEMAERLRRVTALEGNQAKVGTAVWVVDGSVDRFGVSGADKALVLASEVHGFVDGLYALFPGMREDVDRQMVSAVRLAIDQRGLRLLSDTMDDGESDLGRIAGDRLKELHATVNEELAGLSVSDENEDDLERSFNNYLAEKKFGALLVYVVEPLANSTRASAGAEWSVSVDKNWPTALEDEVKGFVRPAHASFELYKKKKYMKEWDTDRRFSSTDSESHVLLDVESHPKFENANPGTVTVEGFGLECWEFENEKPHTYSVFVNRNKLPVMPASNLLRRLDELQKGSRAFGWDPTTDDLNVKDMVGTVGIKYFNQSYAKDPSLWIGDLYGVLNRDDVFADFTTTSSVGLQFLSVSDEYIGLWNFLRQVIVAKELAMRLQTIEAADNYAGLTHRVLASLIISDLWLRHVDIVLTNVKVDTNGVNEPNAAQVAEAERHRDRGNAAMGSANYVEAVEHYNRSIDIDLRSAIYRSSRSAAKLGQGNLEEAEEDALMATLLDPRSAEAWSCLGAATLKQGHSRRAEKAYQRAVELAGAEATAATRQGFANAKRAVQRAVEAIEAAAANPARQHELRSEFLAQDFDLFGMNVEMHSRVHMQQVEGLLLFARRMRWPFLEETRVSAEEAYERIFALGDVNVNLHDWLFGTMLPGKWFAFTLMSALIMCSGPVGDRLGIAPFYDCGLALPGHASYWRSRTVLASVLGCLPGIISLGGWVGPCPAVTFDAPIDGSKARHVRLSARRASPFQSSAGLDGAIWVGPRLGEDPTQKRPGEKVASYVAEMIDPTKWKVPAAPAQEKEGAAYEVKEIRLSKVRNLDEGENMECRACITFQRGKDSNPFSYRLFTNPIFVTLPVCRPPLGNDRWQGSHQVHERELSLFTERVWSVSELKSNSPEAEVEGSGRVIVINATAKGAQAVARAWCSEMGKNAVIRLPGGPCFVCAVRAAGYNGLKVGVLIWVG
ncbi:hypothetical protein DL95DRAFT_529055 [Leptodontidium sp. 2 PMI_412]|nr:hypothetical protein DL95DRAFT_529055 [Leptodontidium sp. 2 PMI_412]